MRHVFARVESGAIFLLTTDQRILSLHAVGRFANLRRVVVEAVIHVLHVHHVHVAGAAFNQRQLLNVTSLVAI